MAVREDGIAKRGWRGPQGFGTAVELGLRLEQGKELRNFGLLNVTDLHAIDCRCSGPNV